MSHNIEGDKMRAAPVRKSAKLTRRRVIFLGALAGGISAFLMSAIILAAIGLTSSLPYFLFEMALGAFSGAIVTAIAGKHEISRGVALSIAAFIGFLIPVCLLQALLLLVGID